MKKIYFLLLVILPFASSSQDAISILRETQRAYGGTAWDNVNYISMRHFGHMQWLEQSENPQGPFITSYEDTEEVRSVKGLKLYLKRETKTIQSVDSSVNVQNDILGFMKLGERKMRLPYSFSKENIYWVHYGPEHLIQYALSSGARLDRQIELEGVKHYQLSFAQDEVGYRIFINANTFLISEAQIDTYSPYEFFFSLWGKFTTRIQYSMYSLYPKGIVYPAQWDIYRTGQLWKKITINRIEFLETCDESIFTIPEDIMKVPESKVNVNDTKLSVGKAIEVATGIFVIPGNWFTGWAEQEDGIVVIEAPISSGYSVQLLNEVKKRYPAKKVKAVVVSSDAWPHLAGVREYFSAGIPVYTSKLNKAILDRVAVVDHSPAPDHQQSRKAAPIYKLVDKTVTIDDKILPIQIIPVNGEGGERMVAVYFPKQKVLYASDLVQRNGNGDFFFIQYLAEVKAVVNRHKLDVETVYAMHLKPIAWSEIETALEKTNNY